jgi:hypothetical protein
VEEGGDAAVADTLAIAADVIDAAGDVRRREQDAAGVFCVQRGAPRSVIPYRADPACRVDKDMGGGHP